MTRLRIGSRGSKLALTQAEWVGRQLQVKTPELDISFVRITTTGDRQSESASPSGGKGVFVKEIEEALLRNEIDLAVHSLKDVPQEIPTGLRLGPCPQREDPRDAFISRFGEQLHELPRRSIIGTSSPRRQAQILHKYRKRAYKLEMVRGNVDTRLKKLHEGQFDAIVLAAAGLKRLGMENEIIQYLEIDELMPAPCQGCLGLELRESDVSTWELLHTIRDENSDVVARAERAFLQGLGGNCNVPVGCSTVMDQGNLKMKALLLTPQGDQAVGASQEGSQMNPELVGGQLAERLLYNGGSEIMMSSHKVS